MLKLPLVLCTVVFFTTVARAENPVGGRWYMEGVEHDMAFQYVVERLDDGTFSATIRTVNDCKFGKPWIETGRWEYRDNTLFNVTETTDGHHVDTNDPEYQDSFRVTPVDQDHARLYDLKTHIEFLTTRVDSGFTFPVPSACSV